MSVLTVGYFYTEKGGAKPQIPANWGVGRILSILNEFSLHGHVYQFFIKAEAYKFICLKWH